MSGKTFFDLALVVPLEEEMQVILEIFPVIADFSTREATWVEADPAKEGLRILIAQQEREGRMEAVKTASQVCDQFDIGMVVCIGIAGCLTDDLRLGDVVYSGEIWDVVDNAKASDVDDQLHIDFSPTPYETPREATHAFNQVRIIEPLKTGYRKWQSEREAAAKALVPGDFPGRNFESEQIAPPNTKNGKVLCGDVSKSAIYNKRLSYVERKLLCIETESGGVFAAAKRHRVPAITIRGLCDHADAQKNKLEIGTGGALRRIAAENAASFLKLQLRNARFLSFIAEQKAVRLNSGAATSPEQPPLPLDDLQSIIRDGQRAISERLGDVSIELKRPEKGFRLPVPRVRFVPELATSRAIPEEELDVGSMVARGTVALLRTPKSYPDSSLPWTIADYLLTSSEDDLQLVPVVVEGDKLRLPSKGFAANVENDLIGRCQRTKGAKLTIIVENPPLSSTQRVRFLVSEIQKYAEAKFIILLREDANPVAQSELRTQLGAALYELCAISFSEIALFVHDCFAMSMSEAEVVALRLRKVFRQFDLTVHPSYFAGIPKQVLFKLLDANSRIELLKLAVEGSLLLLVADDRSSVRVTRTKRSEFLRLLVNEISIEKRRPTHEETISITREFIRKFDLEIDPLVFINDFVRAGILHFSDDKVQFSLPFMERVLLATELSHKPGKAVKYFQLLDENFDYDTFDLYAEIGPSDKVVSEVLAITSGAVPDGEESRNHILLTDAIRPKILDDVRRFSRVQNRISTLVAESHSSKARSVEKQRLLDSADKLQQLTEAESRSSPASLLNSSSGRFNELSRLAHILSLGVIVLGSGAENLKATSKRALARAVIRLAREVMDKWSRELAKIDFQEIRRRILSKDAIDQILAMHPAKNGNAGSATSEQRAEMELVLAGLFDLIEFSTLATPLRQILGFVCERASGKILAASLEGAAKASSGAEPFEGQLDYLIYATWISDIDSQRGRKDLISAIKKLPALKFLRLSLSSHLMTRVYWDQWLVEDRKNLLDAAEEAIRPFIKMDAKDKILRAIQNSPATEDAGAPKASNKRDN